MVVEMNQMAALRDAVCASDAERVREIVTAHPDVRAVIDSPLPDYAFGIHALYAAVQRSDRATVDVLLEAGSDIRKRTEWWAGGFGVLDECAPELAPFLIERGAVLDAHSAARLGMLEQLKEMLADDARLVHARGGDGQTPLHFASTVPVAEILLEHGADVNALDVDHESTPAQYMLRVNQRRHYPQDRQDVARLLVLRGCKTELLMATALGDLELVRRHLDEAPGRIYMDVSAKWFPMRDPRAGGTIYIWVLGKGRTAHSVARDFGHEDIFEFLLERTPEDLKLTLACELGDVERCRQLVISGLSAEQLLKLPSAGQSNNTAAVRAMLEAGWPVDTRGEMGATALHWAAFNGNVEMVREILRFRPALELKSTEYESTALQWGMFASENGQHRDGTDYPGVLEALGGE